MSEETNVFGEIFGWVGTGLGMIFYIAPVVPFSKLVNDQLKINEVPGILLLCTFISTILWTDYGLLNNVYQIYLSNSIGGGITLIWITIFLIFLGKQTIKYALLLIIFLMIVIGGISYIFYFIVKPKITGILGMIFNVLMYAAPFEKITKVVKTKKYNLIPIYSTFGGFFCTLCWLIFGIYKKDLNLYLPNGLGLACLTAQIIVYYYFYCKKTKPIEEDYDIIEEEENKL